MPEELRGAALNEAPPRSAGAVPLHEAPPPAPPLGTSDASLRTRVRSYEADLIRDALRKTAGSRAQAALLLAMPLRTLAEKIRMYDLDGGIDSTRAGKRAAADSP